MPTTLFCDIDMGWAEDLRAKLSQVSKHGLISETRSAAQSGRLQDSISITAILLKAIGIAQRAHPRSRSYWLPGGRIATLQRIVAGFTVEKFIGPEPAVFFGTIESPDEKPIEEINSELREYAELEIIDHPQLEIQRRLSEMPWVFRHAFLWLALRLPKIRLRYMPATFGLSSLGKFGVTSVSGPAVCTSTFGVGALEKRAEVRNGKVVVRSMMTLSLIFDHRVIDGAPAARFLQEVKALVEGGLADYLPGEGPDDTCQDKQRMNRSLQRRRKHASQHGAA